MNDTMASTGNWARRGRRASSASVAADVYDQLLGQIMALELEPHALLSEQRLAGMLGVSRTPVREALARLARQGLVDIFPQRGTAVAPLRIADLHKSQFMREALEIGLVRRAIDSPACGELVTSLSDELKLQRTYIEIGDEGRFYQSDETFHALIARHAGLPEVWADISSAKLHMDRYRKLMLSSVERLPGLLEQHHVILDAIAARDAQAAESAMRAHLRRVFELVEKARAARPDYFDNDESTAIA